MTGTTLVDAASAPIVANSVYSDMSLLRLLYIRWAWDLETDTALPPLSSPPQRKPAALGAEPLTADEWAAQWRMTTASIVESWTTSQNAPGDDILSSPEQTTFFDPNSNSEFFDWVRTVSRRQLAPGMAPGASTADVMKAVRSSGFRLWLVVPIHGHYVEKVGDTSLVVSYDTYFSVQAARQALVDFPESV